MDGGKPNRAMQPLHITVRRAARADNHRIATLGRQAFSDSFSADNHPRDMAAYLDRSFGPDIQAAELAEPSSCFLIAEAADKPIGYARMVESPAPACVNASRPINLQRLYAVRNWIGCGVGSALMRASIDEARQRPCDGIWLGVWEKNHRATRFYRRWGFSQVGTQPFLLGDDRQTDLVLWLPLASSSGSGQDQPRQRFDEKRSVVHGDHRPVGTDGRRHHRTRKRGAGRTKP